VNTPEQEKRRRKFHEARLLYGLSPSMTTAKRLYIAASNFQLGGGQHHYELHIAWKLKEQTFDLRKQAIDTDSPGLVYAPVVLRMSANQFVSVLNMLEGRLLATATVEKRAEYYESEERFVIDTIRDIITDCRQKYREQQENIASGVTNISLDALKALRGDLLH
jgi:hypothetical protein